MPSLSRTLSRESAADSQRGNSTTLDRSPSYASTVPFDPNKDAVAPALKSRTASHSLLSSSSNSSNTSRKGRIAETGITIDDSLGRASMSMPPPISKPSTAQLPPAQKAGDPSGTEDLDKTPSLSGAGRHMSSYAALTLPESAIKSPPSANTSGDKESNRLSYSSLFSLGSISHNGTTAPPSASSSTTGSVRGGVTDVPASVPMSSAMGSSKAEASSAPTTATDPISVTTVSHTPLSGIAPAHMMMIQIPPDGKTLEIGTISPRQSVQTGPNVAARHLESWSTGTRPPIVTRRSRSRTQRRPSGSTATSSASPSNMERTSGSQVRTTSAGMIGVCALDVKARSKPSRNILTRLQNNGEFDVVVFGDKVILDEAVENWPLCDYLISFYSDGFPLDKAIAYAQLRKPFCVNDLAMQKVLWDRRLCLRILDSLGVPTPRRLEVNRDGGPTLESADLAHHVKHMTGVQLKGAPNGMGGGMPQAQKIELIDDGDTLLVDGVTLKKPFVEKPVDGDDHNVRIYFPKSHQGGGGRRLFRKIGNKSSEWDPDLKVPRAVTENGTSYVYEQFLHVDNAEDIKAYTVGPDFCHAETRKSPVVDGLVRRNTHGKEIRYITSLTTEEQAMASKIAQGFGQRICGFDLLRVGGKSYVIDVNGWSFVKDNNEYYDKCSSILRRMFLNEKNRRDGKRPTSEVMVPEGMMAGYSGNSSHRTAFKNIFKSPSLTKMRGSQGRTYGTASPEMTTPMTSPSSFDQRQGFNIPRNPSASIDHLPEPAIPSSMPAPGTPVSTASPATDPLTPPVAPLPAPKHSWKLKGMVAVIRHADRTPKQKFKFTFHTQPFVDLLRGHQEEVLLKGEVALNSVLDAVKLALKQGIEDKEKLSLLRTSLARKGAWTGTKVQIKPMFRKRKTDEVTEKDGKEVGATNDEIGDISGEVKKLERTPTRSDSLAGVTLSRFSAAENDLILDKLQLIIKWGGEPTHSARYQSQDLGENMRNDLLLMNREALGDVRVFTSSERRVSTSAQIWAASFLAQKDVPDDLISVRKDLLDDSNAAKDVMDKVKKKLKLLLREGHERPPQFAWPANMPEPHIVVRRVTELMKFHRRLMRSNFSKLSGTAAASLSALNQGGESNAPPVGASSLAQAQAATSIQSRWCCGEDAELFKERWEKLFAEFSDAEKVDPSKISELYDSMKFDALHNPQFLEGIFTPSASFLSEEAITDDKESLNSSSNDGSINFQKPDVKNDNEKSTERETSANFAQRMGFRRKSGFNAVTEPSEETRESYFKLYGGSGQSATTRDSRLDKLRELYKLAKVLFDFVCPQEYGIDDSEKLEIGLLTSLPLLKEIVKDLEEVQASEDAKSFIYFTKESHVYTLLNCIIEGGIKTKIARNAIPELDYLSQIVFELYESEDKEADSFAYSIRITITPGCHTSDPLDVQLDSKHSIGCAPRRSLTAHADWKEVIETLRDKFHTVKLPKSFIAVNLSDLHASDWERGKSGEADEAQTTAGDEQ